MSSSNIDQEKGIPQHDDEGSNKAHIPQPKLDKHGLPLVPQPSDHEDDPLVRCVFSKKKSKNTRDDEDGVANSREYQNWSPRLKLAVLLQISLLSLVGPMAAAVVNPAFVAMSAAFNITAVQASYELAVYVCVSVCTFSRVCLQVFTLPAA